MRLPLIKGARSLPRRIAGGFFERNFLIQTPPFPHPPSISDITHSFYQSKKYLDTNTFR